MSASKLDESVAGLSNKSLSLAPALGVAKFNMKEPVLFVKSELNLLSKSSSLAPTLRVTKFILINIVKLSH
jgi:hypothetical protein